MRLEDSAEEVLAKMLCEAPYCRKDSDTGRSLSRQVAPGLRLCLECRDRLVDDLAELSKLYELSEEALVQRRHCVVERVRGGSPDGILLNDAVVQARSDMFRTLVSYAGMVVNERGVTGPDQREILRLAAFLTVHADWLAAHTTATDIASEIANLVKSAHAAINPNLVTRIELGLCGQPGCDQTVYAVVRTEDELSPTQVSCEAGHVWPPHRWLLLGRTIEQARAASR